MHMGTVDLRKWETGSVWSGQEGYESMKLKIAIVEDDKWDIDILETFLRRYEREHDLELCIFCYCSGEEFLKAASAEKYEIIFMDIYMGEGIDGIETACGLRELGEEGLIVFLTNSRDDIWRAVGMHTCFDYIDKERLDYARTEKLLDDACRKLCRQRKTLEFYSGKQKVRLPLFRIQFMVSQDKYVIIKLMGGREMRCRVTFASLSAMLEGESRFLTCNRGILLNMDHIKKVNTDTFEMTDGSLLPIRKRNHARVMETYYEYQFEKLHEEGWE